MQITRNTIDVLKNFSEINSSILVEEGNTIKTISPMKNILAKADVGDAFEQRFAIYDLIEFLNVATSSVFSGADFSFGENFVVIENGSAKSKYFYADESTIVTPTKQLTMPDAEISFTLKEEDFATLKSMAGVLAKPDLVVRSDGGDIVISVLDKKDATTNDFDLCVGDGDGSSYKQYFKSENLKLFKGNYDVNISSKGISHFKNIDVDVEYWIALEPDSEYTKGGE